MADQKVMLHERPFGTAGFTMSSSVQFGTNSEADSMKYSLENTPKPATRERHVTVRYGGRPRIDGFPPSSIQSFRESQSQRRRPSTTLSQESSRTSYGRPMSIHGGKPCKSTQRPYTSSSRIHPSSSCNEATRCDVLLAANRLFQEHTTGFSAQVPMSCCKNQQTPRNQRYSNSISQ